MARDDLVPTSRQEAKVIDDMRSVLAAVRAGSVNLTEAAEAAGLSRETLYRWLVKAQLGTQPYATFALELDKARVPHKRRMTQVLREAAEGEGDWRAAEALLNRYDKSAGAADMMDRVFDHLSVEEQVAAAAQHPDVIRRVLEAHGQSAAALPPPTDHDVSEVDQGFLQELHEVDDD